MWSFPLWLSQPARMQGQMVTCHCGHPGCIVAAWTPCPDPRVMCLSQLMVQIHLGHSYLCLMGTVPHKVPFVTVTSLSAGPANPLVLGGGGEEKARSDISIKMFQASIRSKCLWQHQENKNKAFFTWQPLLFWVKPAPPLLSVHFSALYHILDAQTSISL